MADSSTCHAPRQFRLGNRLRWSLISVTGGCAVIAWVPIRVLIWSVLSNSPSSADLGTSFGGPCSLAPAPAQPLASSTSMSNEIASRITIFPYERRQAWVPAAAQAICALLASLLSWVAVSLSDWPPVRSPIFRSSFVAPKDHDRIGLAISGESPGVSAAFIAEAAAWRSAVRPLVLVVLMVGSP